jgi:hypothetical protein
MHSSHRWKLVREATMFWHPRRREGHRGSPLPDRMAHTRRWPARRVARSPGRHDEDPQLEGPTLDDAAALQWCRPRCTRGCSTGTCCGSCSARGAALPRSDRPRPVPPVACSTGGCSTSGCSTGCATGGCSTGSCGAGGGVGAATVGLGVAMVFAAARGVTGAAGEVLVGGGAAG